MMGAFWQAGVRTIRRGLAVPALLRSWPLLERMAWSLGQDSPLPAVERPAGGVSISLPAEAVTPESIHAAIRGAGGQACDILLPPGRFVLRDTIGLPSYTRLIGSRDGTLLRFENALRGIAVQGTFDAPVMGAEVCRLTLEFVRPSTPHGMALYCSRACGCRFEDVEIVAPEPWGIVLADGVRGAELLRCRVRKAHGDGILFVRDVTGIRLGDCLSEHSGGAGFLLADWHRPADILPEDFTGQFERLAAGHVGFLPTDPGPMGIVVSGCAFRHNRKMGICCDGVGMLDVFDSALERNECEGITMDNGSWLIRAEHCRIRGNGRRGLQRACELDEDQVRADGLLPDGSSPVKLPGVSLDNAAYCTVKDNLIEGNYGDGVKCVRSVAWCRVEGNDIVANNRGFSPGHPHNGVRIGADIASYGGQFDFASSRNLVTGNRILGDHVCGVLLNAGTRGNVVRSNHIRGAREAACRNRFPFWNCC